VHILFSFIARRGTRGLGLGMGVWHAGGQLQPAGYCDLTPSSPVVPHTVGQIGGEFGRLLKAHMSPQDHRRKIAISRRHLHGFRSNFDVWPRSWPGARGKVARMYTRDRLHSRYSRAARNGRNGAPAGDRVSRRDLGATSAVWGRCGAVRIRNDP